jgi:hypothetical protein
MKPIHYALMFFMSATFLQAGFLINEAIEWYLALRPGTLNIDEIK